MEALTNIGAVATELSGSAFLWAGNFLALIVLTVILLVFAMKGGRSGLISVIVALYVGYALYLIFPFTGMLVAFGGTPLIQAAISIVLFLMLSFLPFLIIRRITGGGFGSLSFIPNLLLSLLAAGFLLALGYHVFEIHQIYTFPDPLNQLFAPDGYFFYWFIAPLIGLFFLAR